jgi:putative flippase GtrA
VIRQPLLFVLVGGLQYLLDAALFGLLLSFGLSTASANVLSRGTAAAGGFLVNRYLTFSTRSDNLDRFSSSLLRFLGLWVVMTLLSTLLIMLLKHGWGDAVKLQLAGKLLVEALLAVISFLVSKYWVFRD